jgi:hypothetical protein
MSSRNVLTQKRKNCNFHSGNNIAGKHARGKNYDLQDMVFAATLNTENFTDENKSYDRGACGHY